MIKGIGSAYKNSSVSSLFGGTVLEMCEFLLLSTSTTARSTSFDRLGLFENVLYLRTISK